MKPLDEPFSEGEIAAGIYHVGGRVPAGEAAVDILGIHHPYPHDSDLLRKKIAHFFGFNDIQQLPWSQSGSTTIGHEATLRIQEGDPEDSEIKMFSAPENQNQHHVMKGRFQKAASMPLGPLEMHIAITVFQLSKELDSLIIHEDDGTVRGVSDRERDRIQELIGHLFDLPGMAE